MSCCKGPRTGPEFDPDFEGPSECDLERFGSDTIACPNCTSDIPDDALQCGVCGLWLEEADLLGASSKMSPRLVGGVALALVVALVAWVIF